MVLGSWNDDIGVCGEELGKETPSEMVRSPPEMVTWVATREQERTKYGVTATVSSPGYLLTVFVVFL